MRKIYVQQITFQNTNESEQASKSKKSSLRLSVTPQITYTYSSFSRIPMGSNTSKRSCGFVCVLKGGEVGVQGKNIETTNQITFYLSKCNWDPNRFKYIHTVLAVSVTSCICSSGGSVQSLVLTMY